MALKIVESLQNEGQDVAHRRVPILHNLGLLQMEFGRSAPAAAYFNQAAALARELLPKAQGQRAVVLKEDLARILLNSAQALDSLGETKLALERAAEAGQVSKEIKDRIGEGDVLVFQGYLRNNRGDYANAESVLKEALQIQRELGDRSGQSRALASLGFTYSRTNRPADAEQMYREALKLEGRGGRSNLATRLNLATILVAQHRTAEAESEYVETLALLNTVLETQARFLSEVEQLSFLENVTYATELYLNFCLGQRSKNAAVTETMYDTLLRQKGLVVLNEAARRSRIAASGPEAAALLQELSDTRQRLSVMARRGGASGNAQQIAELEERVVGLERRLAARIDGPDARVGPRITWRDVQQRLRPGDAAVEFARFRLHNGIRFTGDTRYIALVITPRDTRPQLVNLGSAEEIGAALEDLRSLTGATHALYSSAGFGRLSADTLWKSLETALRGARRVFLSPDGELHKVSWSVLRVRADEPLMTTHDIRVVLSTRDLLRTPRPVASGTAVLVGNPAFTLPGTADAVTPPVIEPLAAAARGPEKRRADDCAGWKDLKNTEEEVRDIAQTLQSRGWTIDMHLREDASEKAVKSVSAPRVLHLATHGCFKPDPPKADGPGDSLPRQLDATLRSLLAFAGANRSGTGSGGNPAADDGELTAYEASALNLQGTELVVLSACETGLGEISNGEGVLGLRRAFQIAGAEAVLMSLWKVPDAETKELMNRFYRHWVGGLDKHAALRRAQLEVRDQVRRNQAYGKADLPFFWGAFVLVGS